MKKAKRAAIAGAALILSAVLLIAFTAFFSVFDFNRKVDDFVNTLPGNESDAPLPDEPETTLPGDSDIVDAPDNPSVTPEPGAAEATSDGTATKLGKSYIGGTARVESHWSWFDYKFTDASGSSKIDISKLENRYKIAKEKNYLQFAAIATVNINDKGYDQSATATAGSVSSIAKGKSGSLRGATVTIPANCTAITISWYVQTEDGKSSGFGGANVAELKDMGVDIVKGESNVPTIGVTNNAVTTQKFVNISDSESGLYRIYYKFNDGTTSNKQYDSYTKSIDFNFSQTGLGTGKYEIWAEDNLGNTSSHCIVYYREVDLTATAYTNGSASTTGGTITPTSSNGLNAGDTVTFTIKANPGYIFVGFSYCTSTSINDVSSFSTAFNPSITIQNVGMTTSANAKHTVQAFFIKIEVSPPSDLTYNRSTKSVTVTVDPGNLTSTLNTAPDKVDEIVNKLFPGGKADMTYFSLSYSGTTAGGSSWSDVPKYAGTYTPTVTCTYSNTKIGTYTGSAYTISPMTVYIGAVLDTTSKTYDGSKVVKASAFGIYEDAGLTKTYGYDSLSYSGSSTITLNSANAGTQGFELTSPGNLKLKLTADNADNNDILASYNAEVVTDKAGGGISSYKVEKRKVNIDATAIVIKTGADTAAAFTGKVYDGTKALGTDVTAFVYTSEDAVTEFAATDYPEGTIGVCIKLGNLVGGDSLSAAFRAAAETVYFTEPAFNGSDVGTTILSGLNFNVNATNYLKGGYNADSVSLEIEKLGIDASFGLAGSLTYDGSTEVSTEELTAQLNGVLSADNGKVSLSGYTGTLSNGNAGSGRTITVTGYSLTGNKAGNYKLNNAEYEITGVEIAKRTTTVTPSYKNPVKLYDGTTAAIKESVSFTYSNAVDDNVIEDFTVRYSDKNAGSRDIIIEIVPHDNYDIAQIRYTIAATISAKPLKAEGIELWEGIELGLDYVTYTYTGETFTPTLVTHTDIFGDGTSYTLIEDTDYTVNVEEGVGAGTYHVTVTGKGNYAETVQLAYTIEKSDFTVDLGKEAAITLDYGMTAPRSTTPRGLPIITKREATP